jgi:hypothetical protein
MAQVTPSFVVWRHNIPVYIWKSMRVGFFCTDWFAYRLNV